MSADQDTKRSDEQLFQDLDADAAASEVESLCMQCQNNGVTRLLLTRIPHFKSVILMAFECPHCGFRNNEVRSGEAMQETGHIHELRCTTKADLNRQIVRNNTASISIPEIEFTAPPASSSSLTTTEGLVSRFIEDLAADQEQRKEETPEVFQAIESILGKLRNSLTLPEEDGAETSPHAFTLVVDDPTGNSYVENLCAPNPDPKLTVRHYRRTRDQMIEMGYLNPDADDAQWTEKEKQLKVMKAVKDASEAKEILTFPANCSSCNAPCDTRMQMVNIPHFQEVIIMSTTCDKCGFKSNEVKCGGAISPKGRRITLKIEDSEDLSRDILKSETSSFSVPELDLDMIAGTMGGRFTTVEGLLRQLHEELSGRVPFLEGDSAESGRREKFEIFLQRLEETADGKVLPFTIIVDDPMSHSYVQNLYAPDPDPNMVCEDYERTFEQNEDLGLNDINTENYEQVEPAQNK
ncbi:zf-ZPR1-domain-containing protein [Coemansia reversa NRRL 1564]|uniref:Zf-ZPR1-domain-containing protein n=1 Tax=Coemansia reversa (strain ATCC 12441 / NRRL 1564) TaxID=763665 RepID=A0A2G5B598_COERN|nr:zf-ZPR1-domain-containing protein [Coemansia reversa NRRL 1564]|eukprot:PIA14174.1 zf-ZPR1-domain-containing protein [Coemansia reversa NRRL 1564]